MTKVTQLLNAIKQGDVAASADLLPLVYSELRRLAQSRLANESGPQTLQPTALVHEAYLRLVDVENPQDWNTQGHFFAAAALAMRRILIDNARKKKALRRGGGRGKLSLDQVNVANPDDPEFLLGLDECLERLAEEHPEVADVVNLKFFGGRSIAETAQAMQISVRSVNRHWAYAKAWLYNELSPHEPN